MAACCSRDQVFSGSEPAAHLARRHAHRARRQWRAESAAQRVWRRRLERAAPARGSAPTLWTWPAGSGRRVAYAHGLPADVWTFGLDGSNLARVADLKEDDPNVAWSPDGSRLAVFGSPRCTWSTRAAGTPSKLVDQGGYGGLDWTR